jgi:protein tyrosine phosphatase (PTP) superfamily phosphohydrolase (DUF442 family)
LSFAGLCNAQIQSSERLSGIRIENFGRINANYYRGAQPEESDFPALASLGIRTVIDLQREGERDEQRLVEDAGMKFFRIPMSTKSRPQQVQIREFMRIVNDPVNQPVFVHCRGGRHRTGVMTAVYRMSQDRWGPDQAYAEMKAYQFEKGFGHGALRKYVYEAAASGEIVGVASTETHAAPVAAGSSNR